MFSSSLSWNYTQVYAKQSSSEVSRLKNKFLITENARRQQCSKMTDAGNIVRWPIRAVQKYLSQYKNIYSSTKIFIPVQKYFSQYKNIYPSTKIFIPVQKYFSQYKSIYPSTKIFFPVQKYFSSTNREWDLFSQRSLRASSEHMWIWQLLSRLREARWPHG